MSVASDMTEKHARILGELAEFGLDFARKLHGQGMAAETPEETASVARAFHTVSRSIRQSVALEAKLAREALQREREDRADAERLARDEDLSERFRAQAPILARRSRLSNVLERIVYAESEDEDEAERLVEEIDERLDDEAKAPDFLEHALDDQITRLCREFGLPAPKRPAAPPEPSGGSVPHALGDWTGPP